MKKAEDSNGFMGSAWSGFKNLTGIGDSSDKVREKQEVEQKLLVQFNSNPQKRAEIFKNLTGRDYTPENLLKFIKGEIKLPSELALNGYKEGQEMAVDVGADIVSGVAAAGIYTAAVVAAPFTAGTSIAAGVVAATATGAAVKTVLKAGDAASGGREYSLKDVGHDAATGAFSGVLAPVTGGMGAAVGKTVATKLGVQAVKTVGKEVAEEVVESGVKQTVKTLLTNPTGYEYVGGTVAKRAVALGAEMAVDGAAGGAVDNAFRTALDGGSVTEVLEAAGEGAVGGLILSPVIGGGVKVAGRTVSKGLEYGKLTVKDGTEVIENKLNDVHSAKSAEMKAKAQTYDKAARRAELLEKVRAGKIRIKQNPNESEIVIPKAKLAAPRSGFGETVQDYVNLIKNNEDKILQITNEYFSDVIDEKGLIDKFMNLLVIEMDMPIPPKVLIKEMEGLGGAFNPGEMAVKINLKNKSRVSELFATVMHETHHFLQHKEMLLTDMGRYTKRIADKNSTTSSAIEKWLLDDVGWRDVLEQYPKNTNPKSSYSKRGIELLEADANYTMDDMNAYTMNLKEVETREIQTRVGLEVERIIGGISEQDYQNATKVYSLLNLHFTEDQSLINAKVTFDSAPSIDLVKYVNRYSNMRLEPNEIVVKMLDDFDSSFALPVQSKPKWYNPLSWFN